MRTSILPLLAIGATVLAFNEYDNYEKIISARDAENALTELLIREALADPNFKGFISGVRNDFRKAGSFISNHKGRIIEGVKTAAEFTPFLLAREGGEDGLYRRDLDEELYAREPEAKFYASGLEAGYDW